MTINKSGLLKIILFLSSLAILAPVALAAVWSFINRWAWPDLLPGGLSLRGMAELFGSHSKASSILVSSVLLSLAAALIATVFGFMAARAFALYEFRGKSVIRFSSMLPVIIPANVFAMGIHVTFIRWGLNDSVIGVLICHILYSLPYTVNGLTGVTAHIGRKYEEQAAVLGCVPGKALISVTLPLMLPALLSSASMAYIISFSQYFLTLLIGGGRVQTFSTIMVPFISGGDRTIACAYVMMFLLSSIFVFVIFEFMAKKLSVKLKG